MSALLPPTWDELAESRPVLVTTMGRYLQQVACSLRPRSVGGVDLALRSFVAFLLERGDNASARPGCVDPTVPAARVHPIEVERDVLTGRCSCSFLWLLVWIGGCGRTSRCRECRGDPSRGSR
jgi:hypothetical protein